MSISVESTKSKILVTIKGEGSYMLQRALYDKGAKWLSLTSNGFVDTTEQLAEFLFLQEGDFVDSFDLKDGIYEYRIVSSLIQNPTDTDYEYSEYVTKTDSNFFSLSRFTLPFAYKTIGGQGTSFNSLG